MPTAEDLDRWFTYHAPTEETKPKYNALRNAEAQALASLNVQGLPIQDAFQQITQSLRDYAQVIVDTTPPSADQTASIRCVRVARMLANEACVATATAPPYHSEDLMEQARLELLKARHQACAAIACEGK